MEDNNVDDMWKCFGEDVPDDGQKQAAFDIAVWLNNTSRDQLLRSLPASYVLSQMRLAARLLVDMQTEINALRSAYGYPPADIIGKMNDARR